MGPRPWRPAAELDAALERGDLDYAVTLAVGLTAEGKLDLATALRFLPLVAEQQPQDFDAWACRWFVRWLEARPRTIEQAADVAGQLADLPAEPSIIEALRL